MTGVSCRVRDQLVEQELIYEKLPKDIANRHVLLMDPILATGNSAARAIQASLSERHALFVHNLYGSYIASVPQHFDVFRQATP